MIRVLCTTNTCTLQRAQLHHAAQTIVTLRGELAQRDGQLAAAQAREEALSAALQGAYESYAFYYSGYQELAKGAAHGTK